MAEPDAIEIKVNIGGDVEHALTALDLNGGKQRRVWFLDDLTEGVRPPLPLLSAGLILRLRRRENGKEESTIKLRPCRRSQLTGSWNIAPKMTGRPHREGLVAHPSRPGRLMRCRSGAGHH